MRSRHLLIANWKMNLGPAAAASYCRELAASGGVWSHTDVWLAPPMISLTSSVAALPSGSPMRIGAQNCHWERSGAFTGESAAAELAQLGCSFAIVGHSERRHLFGESDSLVAQRMKGALAAGLDPVVCIGELAPERAEGKTDSVLTRQLTPIFEALDAAGAARTIIAYEPVWAIGTGKVATIAEISSTHQFIGSLWRDRGFTTSPVILYGGSVNPQNFSEILALAEVDGALVGGASLKLDQWNQLIGIAEKTPVTR